MISFRDVVTSKLGGRGDALAFLLMMAGGWVTIPGLLGQGWMGAAAGAGLGCAGGAMLGARLTKRLRTRAFAGAGSELELNSDAVPASDGAGVSLGYVGDTLEELRIPLREWSRHVMIVGQSGVGKTVLGEWIMQQQIAAGGGLLWIDGKLDPSNLEHLWQACCWAGRERDLLVINPGNPSLTNTYNPLLSGTPDEVAGRCLALIPEAESNAGADFYRQGAGAAVAALVGAIQATGRPFSFADLRVLLTAPKALEWLFSEIKGSDAATEFALFLDQYRRLDKVSRERSIDGNELKKAFGGLGHRLAALGSGSFGRVMNTYAPEVDLFEAVTHNKIVYAMLPTMGKSEAASALGKLLIGDFRTAIATVQALPEAQRPNPPFLGFFDEAGSYVTQAWSRMFEQARSARLVMVPAFQTKANLETLGPELLAMVAGNTLTKIFFKPGEPDTAEWMADMLGKELQVQRSVSESHAQMLQGGSLADHSAGHGGAGARGNAGGSESQSVKQDYKVTPDDLVRLGKGEAAAVHDGSRVYHLHVPRVTFDREFVDACGPFRLNHPHVEAAAAGLDLLAHADHFLGG